MLLRDSDGGASVGANRHEAAIINTDMEVISLTADTGDIEALKWRDN